jgi:hypothetical protein
MRQAIVLLLVVSLGGSAPRDTGARVASVSGTVFDSIGGSVLPSARIQFVGTAGASAGRMYTAQSDSSGRYAVTDLPPGSYLAAFYHAALDTLGIELSPRPVDVSGSDQRFNLASPSPRSLIATLCPTRQRGDSTGLLIGHVRETETEEPIAGAKVSVEWSETVIDAGGVRTRPRLGAVETDGPGWFAICGIPSGVALAARAAKAADSSGFVEIELPDAGVRHVTLLVGGAAFVPAVAPAPNENDRKRGAWRGGARLSGRVLDARGQPIVNAQAALWGSDRDVRTTETGTFVLDSLPGGTQTLEVKALGFAPVRRVVQLAEGRPATADVRLVTQAQVLSNVNVRGELVYSKRLADFDRRRRGAILGTFITPRDIENRPVTPLPSLLTEVPYMKVTLSGTNSTGGRSDIGQRGGPTVLMQADRAGEFCTPSLFVDGIPEPNPDAFAFGRYRSDEIAAIEVYRKRRDRPLEFSDQNECGAIVIWTRPPASKVKKKK